MTRPLTARRLAAALAEGLAPAWAPGPTAHGGRAPLGRYVVRQPLRVRAGAALDSAVVVASLQPGEVVQAVEFQTVGDNVGGCQRLRVAQGWVSLKPHLLARLGDGEDVPGIGGKGFSAAERKWLLAATGDQKQEAPRGAEPEPESEPDPVVDAAAAADAEAEKFRARQQQRNSARRLAQEDAARQAEAERAAAAAAEAAREQERAVARRADAHVVRRVGSPHPV
jgi:hypothetical protein